MGRPMAEHLIKAGHRLQLASRSGVPSGMADGDVVNCASAAEAARDADIIITMVPDTPDVEAVLFGPAGVAESAKPGSIVVDMSSISPLASKQFAARLGERGIGCLDAPVSGGEVGAKAGSLTIMVGGPTDLFEKVKPLFELMGRNINQVGEHGAGQTTKVANQIIVALTIEAVSEALVFASRAGADPARVREALLGGFANSRVLEVHGERMIKRNFAPGFRIELHQKDLNLALENARLMGVSLPATALARSLFSACESHGGGRDDHSSMVRALELLANHEIGSSPAEDTAA
jgi:2-hydroxy-3-oxopropionate reductase